MWPFKKKMSYKKLKRQEIIDAIYQLEKQESMIEDGIVEKNEQIASLLKKGRVEKTQELKLIYAKKINELKAGIQTDLKRGMYLLYNTKLLNRLKDALDEKEFFLGTTKVSLGNLLADQKGLAKFLNKALNTRIRAEDVLTSSDDLFNEVQNAYEENKEIYAPSKNDDELLAVFESEDDLKLEEKADAKPLAEEPLSTNNN